MENWKEELKILLEREEEEILLAERVAKPYSGKRREDIYNFVEKEIEKAREELADEVAREIGYGKLSGEEHYKTLNRVIKLISKLKDNK